MVLLFQFSQMSSDNGSLATSSVIRAVKCMGIVHWLRCST